MGCFEYYYNNLNSIQKRAYRDVLKGLSEHRNLINIRGLFDASTISDVMSAIKYDHPETFYVDYSKYGYGRTPLGSAVSIDYLCDRSETDNNKHHLNKMIENTIKDAGVSVHDSDILKLRKLHNYIVRNFKYDELAVRRPERHIGSFSSFETLKNKNGVCEGISKVYKLMCDNMNLKTGILIGESALPGFEMNMNHAWNICQIGEDYCHIDVTWDMGLSQSGQFYRYDYFGLTDDRIKKDHRFVVKNHCITEKYDYFINTNKDICNKSTLKQYVETQINKGLSNIYFRISIKDSYRGSLNMTVQKIIEDVMRTNPMRSFSYTVFKNEAQNVFLYKIDINQGRR